ncbi:uncharacterized protein LOC111921268 [Lactuca sativa]|uniref:ARID domain-containing protein n=1 Tax=Lactuca sativa TaxID=4236 RepID=A0A9R1UL37_LACSA|nr:uncharacterized protein LOC111921268 [Lactuca sativa]KAJ0188858.1 hypothetical protein LSAT_V11C900472080 [Lactuca sativa]
MNKREGKGPPSRDLMVCFPTRAHLRLMPKSVSSPRRLNYHQNHLRKSMRGGAGGGRASPYLWSGTKQMSSDNLSEPTSPKVTCAGQIKVRPSTRSCKNWQTVMEEIERLHNRKKKPTWGATLGFKKEIMQFLTCLRRIKFDFHCLGGFSHVDITSDDEDEDEDSNDKEINQDQHQDYEHDKDSRTVFSKWFMVLQENQDSGVFEKEEKSLKSETPEDLPCLPPANALFLMRCRSAPAKSWMEEKQEEEEEEEENDDDDVEDHDKEEKEHVDDHDIEKKENKRKSLKELMKTESDFYKLSCDIAKETWVIGGIHKDPFSRSRSWKR